MRKGREGKGKRGGENEEGNKKMRKEREGCKYGKIIRKREGEKKERKRG